MLYFPWLYNWLKCSVAGRCLIGFSLLQNALQNLHYAVWFLKCCLNRCCTEPLDFKKISRTLFLFQSMHITRACLPTSHMPGSLPLFLWFLPLSYKRSSKGLCFFSSWVELLLFIELCPETRRSMEPSAKSHLRGMRSVSQSSAASRWWHSFSFDPDRGWQCLLGYVIGEREGSNRDQNIPNCKHINGKPVVLLFPMLRHWAPHSALTTRA